jgi:hypothetical protein
MLGGLAFFALAPPGLVVLPVVVASVWIALFCWAWVLTVRQMDQARPASLRELIWEVVVSLAVLGGVVALVWSWQAGWWD